MKLSFKFLLAVIGLLILAPAALAADQVPDATRLFLPQTQLIAALVGSLVPAVTYVLNKHAPWTTEPVKAMVLALVAAAAGALTQLLDAGGIAVSWETAQVVLTAVVLAFLAHAGFWRPSTIAHRLGAGQNVRPRESVSG